MVSLSKTDEAAGASQAAIAAHLFVTKTRIRQLMAEGVIAERASLDAARERYIAHLRTAAARRADSSPEARRLAEAKAKRMEILAAREEGELIPVAEAHAFTVETVGMLIAGLDGLAAQCSRDVSQRRIIETHVDALRERVAVRLDEIAAEHSVGLDTARRRAAHG